MKYCLSLLLLLTLTWSERAHAIHCGKAYQRLGSAIDPNAPTAFLSGPFRKFEQQVAARVKRAGEKWARGEITYFDPQLQKLVNQLQQEGQWRLERVQELRTRRALLRKHVKDDPPPGGRGLDLLKNRKIDLELELIQLGREMAALTELLSPAMQVLGSMAIHAAAGRAARETGALILLRHTRSNAAAQLLNRGIAKGIAYKFHSSHEGVISGLLPYEQRLSKSAAKGPEEVAKMQALVDASVIRGDVTAVPFRLGSLVAVERDGTVKFVDKIQEAIGDDEVVKVLMAKDSSGELQYLVSDVDPFAFSLGVDGSDPVRSTSRWGEITEKEKEILKEFNRSYRRVLGLTDDKLRMTHGPENRNPHAVQVDGYPISAYFPDGKARLIPEGPAGDRDLHLREFYREAKERGYPLEANPGWKWE